jgi:cytochrome subunit of sulfide dehydrogenase
VENFRLAHLKSYLQVAAAIALLGTGGLALSQSAPAPSAPVVLVPLPATEARYLAANCANCHGTDGRAQQGGFNLAGLPKDYIVAQMAAFKAGTRQATIMHQISKGYNDSQIALMAEYFSKQKAAN